MNQFTDLGGGGGTQVCKTLEIVPRFCSHFLCLPSHFLHFHRIFYDFYHIFPALSQYIIRFLLPHFPLQFLRLMLFPRFFLRLMLFSCIFQYFSSHFLSIPSSFLHSIFLHFPMFFLSFPLPTITHISCIFTLFSRYSITFLAFSRHVLAIFLIFPSFFLRLMLFSCIFPYFPLISSHFLSIPSNFLHFQNIFYDFYGIILQWPRYFPAFFLAFSHSFPLISSAYHHISCIFTIFSRYSITFPTFSRHFLAIFLHFPKFFPPFTAAIFCIFMHFPIFVHLFSSHFLSIPSYFLHFHNIFYDFYDIILPYSAAKIADLGGIDTPPSANCLVVHNPAKRSRAREPPFSQPENEIWSHFVNHSPPHPLFSLRSQTATSQLAGFRNIRWALVGFLRHVLVQERKRVRFCSI